MYESQQFVDLPDKASGFEDPNSSWLSEDRNSSPNFRRNQPTIAGSTSGNLGHLFKDLVEIVPLVQSLIERKPASSFTRRGSVIYTKTPSRESLSRKTTDLKGRNAGHSIAGKKKWEGKHGSNGSDAESFSIFSSTRSTTEDKEELDLLKTQLEDLQKKLLEKEESLNSAEALKNEMTSIHSELGALKVQTSEKDSLIKSTQRQLSDAKIKLADKQAALEKVQWEAMTSSSKLEKLQEELNSVQVEVSTLMFLCDRLLKTDSDRRAEDCDVTPCNTDDLPFIDDLDEAEMQRMEKAREAYVAAVALAKQKRDENSAAAAARARLHLQSFVFRQNLAATS